MDMVTRRPLDGVRILDLTRVLSGPFCTAMLADIGAEVIKIESPTGDDQRHIGAMRDGKSINFELINRNKKSLCADLKSDEGRQAVLDLAAQCDVVVENFRPGVAARLGLGPDQLEAAHPGLIYCSLSGFGQQGPMAARPSYDVVAQAMSGFMSVTGEPDGPPVFAGDSVGDMVPGLYAAWAICAALFRRERTGQGERIDVSMFDCLFSLLPTALSQYQLTNQAPTRSGANHPLSAPFGAYRAGDDYFVLAVANDVLFQRLAGVIGAPDLPTDPRFATDQARRANEPALRQVIEQWAGGMTADEVITRLDAEGIPAAPIWDMAQAASSPQIASRGLLCRREVAGLGPLNLPEQPAVFASYPRGAQTPAPKLGADTAEILATIAGWDKERIAAFVGPASSPKETD